MSIKPLLLALSLCLLGRLGQAQPLPAPSDLDRYVGQVVRVTDDRGHTTTGVLLEVSDQTLVISQSAAPASSVAVADVTVITRPFAPDRDSRSGLIVGALVGGAGGAATGAIACAQSCDPTGPTFSVLGGAAIGAGLGVAVGLTTGSIVATLRRGNASHQSVLLRSTLFAAGFGALVGAGTLVSCCKDDTQALVVGTTMVAALGAATAAIVAGRHEPVIFRRNGHGPTRFSTGAMITPTRKVITAAVTF